MNIFNDTYIDSKISKSVRRALCQLDLKREGVQKVLTAANTLREKVQCPIARGATYAHVGFVTRKVAVFVSSKCGGNNRTHRAIQRRHELWGAEGWRLLVVQEDLLERLTAEQVQAQLMEALRATL